MRSRLLQQTLTYLAALCVLLATSLSAWAQDDMSSSAERLSLDQAIEIALQKNRSLKNSQLDVEKSEDEIEAIRTRRLPSSHFYALISEDVVKHEATLTNPLSGIFPGLGPFFTISSQRKPTGVFAAQVLQPISQQYRIGLAIKMAKLEHGVEREKLRSDAQGLVDNVKRTYYEILQTESALATVRDEVKSYRELDRVTADFVIKQVSLKADHLQIQTRLAKAEYDSVDLSNRLATQKEQLNRLLGRDVLTEFNVLAVPQAAILESDLVASRRRALEQRPELQQARLKIKEAEVAKRIKKSEYIPDVSVGFTSLRLENFDHFVPRNIASAGVVVSWEIFDWGRKKKELAQRSIAIEQAENARRDLEDEILLEVGVKFRKLQQTREALNVARLGQETARESLRVTTGRYRLEAALLSDVLQSQAALAEANHQYQNVLLSFWIAKAELEKAMGEEK